MGSGCGKPAGQLINQGLKGRLAKPGLVPGVSESGEANCEESAASSEACTSSASQVPALTSCRDGLS